MSTFEYRPGPAIRVTRLNYLGLYRSTVSVIILLESQVSKEKGFSQTRLSKLPDIPRICQHLCNLPVRLHRYSRWYDRFGPMWSGACLSQALVGGAAFFPQTRPDYVRVKRLCGMSWEFIHKARRILVSALNIIMSSDQPLTRRVQRQRGAEQTNITYKVFHIKSPSIICIMIQPLRFSERLNEKKTLLTFQYFPNTTRRSCLAEWFQSSQTCPLCRRHLTEPGPSLGAVEMTTR